MDALIAFWTHALAAGLFAVLVGWQLHLGVKGNGQRLLLSSLAMTCLWAWVVATEPGSPLAMVAETARNLVWIALLYSIAMSDEHAERQKGVRLVYGAVAAVLGLQFLADTLPHVMPPDASLEAGLVTTAALLRITAAAGGLVLVHNVYGQAAPASRSAISYAMLAFAALWVFDLNYYTIAYLGWDWTQTVYDWRGLVVALTAPLFALAVRRNSLWRIRLSRAATFQSLSILGICAYLVVMAVLTSVLREADGDWSTNGAIALLSVLTVGAIAILPSARARSWAKVKIAKHFFEHRYDYRAEWLRFVDTLGGTREAGSLGQRIARAFADMLEAPGGILIARDRDDNLVQAADWGWPGSTPPIASDADLDALWDQLSKQGHILELDAIRGGWAKGPSLPVPRWMKQDETIWVGIPLIHDHRMVGLVLVAAPDYRRPLDWEDFDLLRTAGRQAASALAEALMQDALAKAERFDEFNRRFAFILHDIKNLVSQLSLVARNAERHADNPEFRADMVATIKSSVGKMNDLLARLNSESGAASEKVGAAPLKDVLGFAVAAKNRGHEVRLLGDIDRWVHADAHGLEQAVGHLLQNAVDASDPDQPVIVRVDGDGDEVTIAIIDTGRGMDGEFVRSRLFEPFASTKDGGFGIGAYEARALIGAMHGRLSVESRPGHGSNFTIHLKKAAPEVAQPTRKSA
ncbi:XrtA/PEP-CTERM system histidine kinase PrsK [Sphingomicrobium clamense]|uniref:histidine kinase n=1 Tax=Sphingomicrobium clamense TaxID=2851013 RepID=A0ABS6V7X2_9SPHN|nr:XrtA/PEP-CTERM system histidine kinase PrsK [Sphingomicrobium sp. B8]MBW0145623.1 PEP-CTERM system histidine kinase PrsK [Sphingomicrobium sp. B8]